MAMAAGALAQEAEPRKGVTCPSNSKCAVRDGKLVCVCDKGYQAEPDGLGCKTEPPNAKKIDFQFGLGLNLGFLPGIKLRLAYTFGENHRAKGLFIGLDADVRTVFINTTATLSPIFGWRFSKWFRLYGTVGGGIYHEGAMSSEPGSEDDLFAIGHFGAGMEWTFRTWFGLGLEVGVDTKGILGDVTPYGGLTLMFYLG
ncbi:MAG: hypothetical protein GY762_22430 [Proteobacteria bacterium]|nr:hypothetical protein [Pseudomonadota bacterium]